MNKEKENKVIGLRHIENVPAGRPYVVAWFDEGGTMYWNAKDVTNHQLSYLGTRLCVEAVRWGNDEI
jgi:hypothetical protein